MWFERIRIKRQLASSDVACRIQAVRALDLQADRTLLIELAAGDLDSRVRTAAIDRFSDPEILINLQANERDEMVLRQLARRIDQLYGEMALRASAEDQYCDAFDRIVSADTLIDVALRSNSPSLVLAAGARLAPQQQFFLRLLEQLQDDNLALELYERNIADPDSPAAAHLLASAQSQALRNYIADVRARRAAAEQAYAEELQIVQAAENCAENVAEADRFEHLNELWRNLPVHHDKLKDRLLAARYRFLRAREQYAANLENENRARAMAADLTARLAEFSQSENWKMIRQIIEQWQRCQLDNSPAAAEYKERFHEMASALNLRYQAYQERINEAVKIAERVLQEYLSMQQAAQLPAAEYRQKLLDELENAAGNCGEIPLALAETRETVYNLEREFRRRARLAAQERDLARWEHYTLKMDICADLEKLSVVPDSKLGEAARLFRTLRERWSAIGPVPNEKFSELQERYGNLCNTIHSRLNQFFAERDAQRQEALKTKQTLLAEAETLSGSEDWSETSARLKELQALWKSAGSAGQPQDRELFERFHQACDAFFVRRNQIWEERKKSCQAAAARKQELCLAAEALKNKPFNLAKSEVAALRELWRNIPSAGKDDRLLYMQFNRAIEDIFVAHREAGDEARRQSEIICTELNEILQQARNGALSIREIEHAVQQNSSRWDALDFRPAGDVTRRRNEISDELQTVLCSLHHQEAMHQLESAEQLESVIDPGDDNDRLIDHLGRRLKVCAELEERLRECRIISGNNLADDLQQAIIGNFGGNDFKLTVAELDEFLQRFVAVGQVPPDARQAVFDRFRTLYNRALTELQLSTAGRDCQEQ